MTAGGLILLGAEQFRLTSMCEHLERLGHRWAVVAPGERVDGAALAEAVGLIVPPERTLTAAELCAAPNVRAVVSPVIGVDHLPLAELSDRGIPVANGAAAENYVGMAEAAIGLIIASLHRFLPKMDALARRGPAPVPVGGLLSGRTVGLVGLGRIGLAIADRLGTFGCRVVAADPGGSSDGRVEVLPLAEMLSVSDVVSIQVPLLPTTRSMIGEKQLDLLPPGAVVVNIGRGGVVDEQALARALDSGHLSAAAVDVWAEEPPPADHPLLGRSDVIATPHNAGHSEETYDRLAALAVDQLVTMLRGERPPYLVRG